MVLTSIKTLLISVHGEMVILSTGFECDVMNHAGLPVALKSHAYSDFRIFLAGDGDECLNKFCRLLSYA